MAQVYLVDAIYMKARDDGRIKSRGFLIATGVNCKAACQVRLACPACQVR